jgi:hypothetical protein
MRILLIAVTFILAAFEVNAQYTRGGGGAFSLGVQTMSTTGITTFDPNAPTLNEVSFSLGGYTYWQFNKLLFGFKGAGVYGNNKEKGNYEYSSSSGYIMADFGYKLINKQKLFVYPFVGVGWGGAVYSINANSTINLTNPTTIYPPIYSGDFNSSNVVFDVGFRIEQLFGLTTENNETGGGLVGIEIGYMFSPNSTNWRTNNNAEVIGGPEQNLNGIYARILIGGFGGY